MTDPADAATDGPAQRDQKKRLRGFVEKGSGWATSERTRLEEGLRTRRQRSALIDAGFEIQELDVHVGGGILAGAVAFRMFLFLVPFVYIVFTVIGAAAKVVHQDASHLAKTIGITGVLASAVVNTSDLSVWSQVLLVLGAAGALLITTSSLIKTLYVVHWLVWGVPRAKAKGIVPICITIGIAIGLTGLVIIANQIRNRAGIGGALIAVLVVTSVSFVLWWWVSWTLPHASCSPRALVPGALFMAIGVEILHLLTTYWIAHLVARKSNTYGVVGIALAVLLWVYVLGRIIVGSAGLNATLWRRDQERKSA
jgi:uncharacterized BrkB/YihY/UPF0761 family membrane protein